MQKILLFVVIISFVFSGLAIADIFKYEDENGQTWFVNDEDAIPLKYREKKKILEEDAGNITIVPKRQNVSKPKSSTNVLEAKKKAVRKQKKVEIFVTSWCGYCRKLENFLRKNNISYKKYDIERNTTGQRMYANLRVRGVPVTKIGNKVISGFNPRGILTELKR